TGRASLFQRLGLKRVVVHSSVRVEDVNVVLPAVGFRLPRRAPVGDLDRPVRLPHLGRGEGRLDPPRHLDGAGGGEAARAGEGGGGQVVGRDVRPCETERDPRSIRHGLHGHPRRGGGHQARLHEILRDQRRRVRGRRAPGRVVGGGRYGRSTDGDDFTRRRG